MIALHAVTDQDFARVLEAASQLTVERLALRT